MDRSVIEVLEQAGSQDPTIFKPAERMLKEWETQKGFYTALFNVFSNTSFSINVRWMAILYFKNGVEKYWRRHAPGEIDAHEKEFLRQGLITNFDEPINQLAIQLAVLIAKIARYDCPKEWISLIPTLLDIMKSENSLKEHRALLIFHHVVKTLASKRLAPDRRIFQDLTASVFNFILNLWNKHTESFILLISNGGDSYEILNYIEKALLSLRTLRKLIIYGISKPSENENAMVFINSIFQRVKNCLELRKIIASKGMQMEIYDKFTIQLTKVLLGMLDIHPFCYIDFIPTSLEFSVFYCFTDVGQSLAFERFIIQCFNLLKKLLISSDYKPAKIMEDTKNPLSLKAFQMKHEFFTAEILIEMCSRLVTHYFVLTPSDLEIWDTDPENFGVEDCGDLRKYNLRPCSESAFLAILHQFRDIFSNVLVELIQKYHQPIDANDIQGILLKDAVYNAVGLAGSDLYDEIDFDQWFCTTLSQELKVKSNNYRIIRRRVCWLIGRWTGIKLSAEYRPRLYHILTDALSPSEDLGVRLAACDALKLAIDDFQFKIEDFTPFLEEIFCLLFSLLKRVNECDTKMRVLYVLSILVERVGCEMKPHVQVLNTYLSELWVQSNHHNMLRCAIVSTLVHLQKALGSDSSILQPLVVSVVELSCDTKQSEHVYLLEDGLELWLALLENTASLTPAILNLFKNMPSILDSSSENLRLSLHINEAYILLSPQDFLSELGFPIIQALGSVLNDLHSEGIVMVTRLIELCLKASPQYGIQFTKPLLVRIFENIYKGDDYPIVLTMYLSIVARVLLYSSEIFVEIIRQVIERIEDCSEEYIFSEIIRIYVGHMPHVINQKRRKLLALALSSLIGSSYTSIILYYFQQIIINIVETLNDITKINDMGCSEDSLLIDNHHSPSQFEDVGYETEHTQRKRRLIFNDPVYCIALDKLLQNQLKGLSRVIGIEQFHHAMQSISAEMSQQLKEYIEI